MAEPLPRAGGETFRDTLLAGTARGVLPYIGSEPKYPV